MTDFPLFHTSLSCFTPHCTVVAPHSRLTVSHLLSLHVVTIHPLPLYCPSTDASWTCIYFCFIYLLNFELFWINSLILSTFTLHFIQFSSLLFSFLAYILVSVVFFNFLEFFASSVVSALHLHFFTLLHTSLLKTFAYIWRQSHTSNTSWSHSHTSHTQWRQLHTSSTALHSYICTIHMLR